MPASGLPCVVFWFNLQKAKKAASKVMQLQYFGKIV
jgi:hypothetical protein